MSFLYALLRGYFYLLQSMFILYKIICIGGSIGIVSGDEKEVPSSLYYFEFIWRLRYETFRRIKRLLITFYQYLSDTLYYKKINLVKVKIIN